MNYKILENFFENIYQFVFEYKLVVVILWCTLMFFFLKKLAKKDNDWYLKDFFKKNKL